MLKYREDLLIPLDKRILKLLHEVFKKCQSALSVKEISEKLNETEPVIRNNIKSLISNNQIICIKRKTTYYMPKVN